MNASAVVTASCAGALAASAGGTDRTGLELRSLEAGRIMKEVAVLDATGRRFALEGAELLEACGATLIVQRDIRFEEVTCGVDGSTGEEIWRNGESGPEMRRMLTGANDDTYFAVEAYRHTDSTYAIAAYDAKTGREQWRTPLRRHVWSMKVGGPVVALSVSEGRKHFTQLLDARTGAVVNEKRAQVGRSLNPVYAVDHSRVLWCLTSELRCERHTGELDWKVRLPFDAVYGQFQVAAADGRIAIRREKRLWVYGA